MTFDLNDEMAQAVTEQQLRASLSLILDEVRSDKPSHHFCEDCGAAIPEARREQDELIAALFGSVVTR